MVAAVTRAAPFAAALALVLLATAWIVLAPTRLGGQTSYVLVVGNSMEPRLHRGDLAVIREAPDYDAGRRGNL